MLDLFSYSFAQQQQQQQQQQLLDPYADVKIDASLKAKQASVKQVHAVSFPVFTGYYLMEGLCNLNSYFLLNYLNPMPAPRRAAF